MKKDLIIVLALLIIVIIIVVIIQKNKQTGDPKVVTNIESLRFSYTRGYMANSDIYYVLDCKEECALIYKPYGVSQDKEKKYKVDANTVMEIEKLLTRYNVYQWNGFNGNDKNVLDGDSFGFYVNLKNGDKIESSGYMKWPKNYGIVKNELEAIFSKIIDV